MTPRCRSDPERITACTLAAIVLYGMWKGRRQDRLAQYLLADRQLQWYTVALSVMATQASAITFLSTPGQGFESGMAFVQNYFGMPLALIIVVCIAAVTAIGTNSNATFSAVGSAIKPAATGS